ncbi:MAG TPA: LPS assembly lipoprotein LptE [Steroidobacteraceae bacterium]|jgi:LPS-assembly lipoprotein|nr:LPS assembly lipoprotein LptE [Steroidobacteraceae bacterium]
MNHAACVRRCVAWSGLGLLALLSTGCGFHLQGSEPLPSSLSEVRIESPDTQSDFYFDLRRALMQAGTRIDEDGQKDGQDGVSAVIHILEDSPALRTLTVSTINVPTEYELTYHLRFSVSIGNREVIAPEEHLLVRDYSYSENAQLAKDREGAILSRALAHDLVSVVMRRLASLPASLPAAAPVVTTPAATTSATAGSAAGDAQAPSH